MMFSCVRALLCVSLLIDRRLETTILLKKGFFKLVINDLLDKLSLPRSKEAHNHVFLTRMLAVRSVVNNKEP